MSQSPPNGASFSPESSAIGHENIAPNHHLHIVNEEDQRTDHKLASCERDLQDLAKLRLKTLEEII